jgi:hypothetical protein
MKINSGSCAILSVSLTLQTIVELFIYPRSSHATRVSYLSTSLSSINEALADSSDPPPPVPDYEDNARDSDLPVEQPPSF